MHMRLLCATVLLALASAHAAAQVLVGQTAGITGPVATGVNETIFGAQLAIDAANAQGGVHGEKIEMLRMDDGFDVKRAGENARVLIEEKKVVALFMSRGTPHSQAVIPWLDRHGGARLRSGGARCCRRTTGGRRRPPRDQGPDRVPLPR